LKGVEWLKNASGLAAVPGTLVSELAILRRNQAAACVINATVGYLKAGHPQKCGYHDDSKGGIDDYEGETKRRAPLELDVPVHRAFEWFDTLIVPWVGLLPRQAQQQIVIVLITETFSLAVVHANNKTCSPASLERC
jgi:hypothetical protein